MRRKFMLGVAALLAIPSINSRADFTITAVHTDLGATNAITTGGNGTIPGFYQMIRFYAENQGASGATENQGTKLNSVDLTMTDMGAGNLVIGGYNQASGTPAAGLAADLFGQHEVSVVNNTYQYKETLTTSTNAPKYVSFVNILGDASVAGDNNANQMLNPILFTPANMYSNYGYGIKFFRVVYGTTNANFGVNATTANGGLGALFAVAVVPFGDSVNVQGQMGGDLGSATGTNFNLTTSVVPGDADLNGTVGGADYAAVVQNYGTGTTWSAGDFHGSGVTGGADYATVVQHYGLSSQAALPGVSPLLAAIAVPEPASAGLLALFGLGFLRRARRSV